MIDIDNGYEFHYGNGVKCVRWRRNGKTKHWKRTPTRFRIPVKHGLWGYGYITDENIGMFHSAEECPNAS